MAIITSLVLTGKEPKNTYQNLVEITSSGAITNGLGVVQTSMWITSSNAISASYALTSSYSLNGGGGGTSLTTGSTYPITSSWSNNNISSSISLTASYLLNKVAMTNKTILYTNSGSNPLSINANRIQWSIQNMATEPLFVKFGTGCNSASLGQWDKILQGGANLDDGLGQYYEDGLGNSVWGGAVSVTASTLIRYVANERY